MNTKILKNNVVNRLKILEFLPCMLCLSMLTACQTDTGSRIQVEPEHSSKRDVSETQRYVKGNLLVGLKPASDYREAIAQLEKLHEGVRLERMLMENDSAVIALFRVPKGQEKTLITSFSEHPSVQYAEVDGVVSIQ